MKNPAVSVIIPTFNRAEMVLNAIHSIQNQTFQDIEIIVIDDGSTDNTASVLSSLVKNNEIVYFHQANAGSSAARNQGITIARGKFIAFLDSDDHFLPEKIKKQVNYLEENPHIGLVHCWSHKYGLDGKDFGLRNTSWFNGWIYPQILSYWDILITPSMVVVPAKICLEAGGFDIQFDHAEDLDLWRRIARKYPFGFIDEVLVNVSVHPGNQSADPDSRLEYFIKVLENGFRDDPGLGKTLQRKAYAEVYSRAGLNYLGEGSKTEMVKSRAYLRQGIRLNPIKISAYIGMLITLLSHHFRSQLVRFWRKSKNR